LPIIGHHVDIALEFCIELSDLITFKLLLPHNLQRLCCPPPENLRYIRNDWKYVILMNGGLWSIPI
jgi:hypothetical protein